MNDISVKAQPDHLTSYTKAAPVAALAELVWNAFDTDATTLVVSIKRGVLGIMVAYRTDFDKQMIQNRFTIFISSPLFKTNNEPRLCR
jgi:hypothetical protein